MDFSSSDDETLQKCENSDAKTGMDNLPAKSREKYLKSYEVFMEWKASKGFKTFSEAVLLAYFQEQSKTRQASTLWVTYSMLRATISANDNVNINTYPKLLSFLKSLSKGHVSKKSKVFSAQDVDNFLKDAPDDIYLAMKVGLIFGISGACRASELVKIRTNDVKKHSDQALLVTLMKSPTKIERSFVIRDEYVQIVEKYQALRPPDTELDRFFIFYQNGKCTRQAIGRHKICEFPKKIAKFLELPNPEMYTGHCLRRTSAALLVQSGADAVMLKQCGGWKSNQGIMQYLDDSYTKRVRIDAPRLPPPTDTLQSESQLVETQQCDYQLAQTQQFDYQLPQTQQFDSQLTQTQFNSQLHATQQYQSHLPETHQYERQNQQCETQQNSAQGQTTWIEINNTEQVKTQQCESTQTDDTQTDGNVTIKIQQCESLADDTQSHWSESPFDESQSIKTDDPFDRIPEECEPPPLARAARRPLYLSVRQLAALERRRLRLDEVRARQLHARETERLRVEARRLEVDAERTRALARIADVAMAWLDYACPQ